MSHQNSCQHKKTRPIAAGLIIALAGPPLGLLPNLLWSAVGLPLGKFPSAVLGVPGFAYVMLGLPAIIAGLAAALTIWRNEWVNSQQWAAATAILPLAWFTWLARGFEIPPAYLLFPTVYILVAAGFSSLVLRWLILALGWMRKP